MIRLKKRIVKTPKSLILLFVNRFMRDGKKDKLYKNFLLVLIRFKHFWQQPFNEILLKILHLITPVVQLRPKFVSGIVYMLPINIKAYKARVLGLSWLVKGVSKRSEVGFKYRLLGEFRDINNDRGFSYTLRYKKEYYKLVLANRALLFKFRYKK